MKKTLLLSLVTLGATAFASSNTFKMTLSQDATVEGQTLKAGDYKVSFENGNAVMKLGKQTVEVPAHEESANSKFSATELEFKDGANLQSVRFGGTRTQLVFAGPASMHSGQ